MYHNAEVSKHQRDGKRIWTWACDCGGYGRQFETERDAEADAAEHVRIMSHCDNAEGK